MSKKQLTDLGAEQHAGNAEFRAAVRDVTPLAKRAPVRAAAASAAPAAVSAAVAKRRARLREAAAGADDLDELMPLVAADREVGSEALVFQRAGLRPQVMRRLRRGLYGIEDELDLHGLTQSAALDRLGDFLAHSRDAGRRCVRIIHGKGYRSGARGPVLKTAVNLWLRRHMDVMAFVSARAIDGGTGAVYVLLRG
jgi:DNA-nicking Smr family endonuclease